MHRTEFPCTTYICLYTYVWEGPEDGRLCGRSEKLERLIHAVHVVQVFSRDIRMEFVGGQVCCVGGKVRCEGISLPNNQVSWKVQISCRRKLRRSCRGI